MVSIEEEGAVTAKIIDLGLAKVADESGAQTTISASGAFAGTPEFASPEQIIGGEVDIRSDLYSLGVSLWQMLTVRCRFEVLPPWSWRSISTRPCRLRSSQAFRSRDWSHRSAPR